MDTVMGIKKEKRKRRKLCLEATGTGHPDYVPDLASLIQTEAWKVETWHSGSVPDLLCDLEHVTRPLGLSGTPPNPLEIRTAVHLLLRILVWLHTQKPLEIPSGDFDGITTACSPHRLGYLTPLGCNFLIGKMREIIVPTL